MQGLGRALGQCLGLIGPDTRMQIQRIGSEQPGRLRDVNKVPDPVLTPRQNGIIAISYLLLRVWV